MKRVAYLVAVALIAASCGGGSNTDFNPDGPGGGLGVVMARPDWNTGHFQAEVTAQLMRELGYDVQPPQENQLTAGQFYPAVATGVVDFWVNGWFPLDDAQLQSELSTGTTVAENVEVIGMEIEAGGLQGYLVDKATADELGLTSMADVANPAVASRFDQDGNGKADLIGCNVGWACEQVIDAHLVGFAWEDTIEQIQGDYYGLLEEAYDRIDAGQPVLLYAWTPTATLGRLVPGEDVLWLPAGNFPGEDTSAQVTGCAADPCELGWVPNDIRMVANAEFLAANPPAASLLASVEFDAQDIFDQNLEMEEGADSQSDIEQQAKRWIADNRELVERWLEVAASA